MRIPLRGWLDIAMRLKDRLGPDRIDLAAAAVAFYAILSLVPAIGLTVSVYGAYTDPATIADHIDLLRGFFPGGGLDLVRAELDRITGARDSTLSISILVTLGLSLWGASAAVRALFKAMNVAYGEEENRNFFQLIGLTLAFTAAAIVGAVVVVNMVVAVPVITSLFGFGSLQGILSAAISPLLMFLISNLAIAALYRWGPCRRPARWRWITAGSLFASIVWMVAASGFAFYLANWSNYNATYGSLGTIIGLMMWFFISAFIVILGAELNAEIELQTMRDSTTGRERPMGDRGAQVADTFGPARTDKQ